MQIPLPLSDIQTPGNHFRHSALSLSSHDDLGHKAGLPQSHHKVLHDKHKGLSLHLPLSPVALAEKVI